MSPRPRTPGAVYSIVSVALLAMLSAVAFSTRQPPPPTIAEFAPQALDQIEDAPEEQTSTEGLGDADCPPGLPDCEAAATTTAPTTSTTTPEEQEEARPTVDVARVRRCVGDPPRQIEDPQSPPCVPFWEGDNGGATYKGITRDEIRITAGGGLENIKEAAQFFNLRFELYGRKFVVVDTSDLHDCDNPETMRAAARAEDEEHHIFAANHTCGGDAGMFPYTAELARRGLIYASHETPFGSSWTRRHHPYLWQYPMEADGMFAHLGEWACNRVVGGTARHAGDPTLRDRERVFGVILDERGPDDPLSAEELTDRLKACGAAPKVVVRDPGQENAANIVLQMKTEGVTSIFCLCFVLDEALFGRAATAQGYFPEWLLSTYDLNDGNFAMKLGFPPEQRENIFGIQLVPMQVGVEDMPGTWACNEIQCQDGLSAIGAYSSMLVIASGVQMAGPNLTPETFAEGLRKTIFPNPDHPIMAGKVGFNEPIVTPNPKYSPAANMAHGMTVDGIEFWWSEAAPDPDRETNGAMCYVARARYRLGEYPKGGDEVFFRPPCDNGAL